MDVSTRVLGLEGKEPTLGEETSIVSRGWEDGNFQLSLRLLF